MARDNEKSHREGHNQNQIRVLTTPGPEITRRAGNRKAHGSQRSAVENFNRQHAEWAGKEFEDDYSVLTDAQARSIQRKIRKALYSGDDDFQIRKGTMTYKDAVRKHGFKLSGLRRKLDSAFSLLTMAEASWASDMFIQEVFKVDRTHKPAGSNWVHPRNRVSGTSATMGLPDTGQRRKNSRARSVTYSSRTSGQLGPHSGSEEVQKNISRGGAQAGTDSGEDSPSRRQSWFSGEEKTGDHEDTRESFPEKNPTQASSQLRGPRKKRRLRKFMEFDDDDGAEEEQSRSGHWQNGNDENEEEEQLLRKLEELRRKRSCRAGN